MKKLIAILLTILMLPTISAFAVDARVTIPSFTVTFNGTQVENSYRQFPLIVYKDITYVPMTYFDCRYLGLKTDWSGETSTLSIEKSDVTTAYRNYEWQWKNGETYKASICNFNIEVNGKAIDNAKEEYPLLTLRDVTYFPLTWRFAVDEFGWDYSFDSENGLSVTSDNFHPENLDLPHLNGGVATDGEYYYYSGDKDDKIVVYRVSVSDTSSPEIVTDLDGNHNNRPVDFIKENGNIYFRHVVGSSPIFQRNQYYKILPDGTAIQENPINYSYSSHGYSEFGAGNEKIKVKGVHPYFDSATNFSYETDSVVIEVKPLPGRVRKTGSVKVFKEKIYFVATDLNTDDDSALYYIDVGTDEAKKLIDNVHGFYVYTGWDNTTGKDSTMILYDNNGKLMRYTEATGEASVIEHGGGEGLVLVGATGQQEIVVVMKTPKGDRTLVKSFDDYASGHGSRNITLLDTKTTTIVRKLDGYLCVYAAGEIDGEEVRFLVTDGSPECYKSSDFPMPTSFFNALYMHENTIFYSIDRNTAVKVNLK